MSAIILVGLGALMAIFRGTCSKVTLDQLLSEQIPGNIVKTLGGKVTFKNLCPIPNLTGADPSSASKSFISLSDLTANMKRTESKHPAVQNSCPDKNALPSTEQLLLTLMEEVKGIKNQILISSNTSSSVSHACSSKTPKQKDYLKRFVWYLDSGCYRHMTGVKQYLHRYSKEPCPKVVFGDDSFGDTEGYGSVNYNGIIFTRVAYVNSLKHNLISISQLYDANFKVLFTKTQGTIFDQSDEVVLISPRRKDVYVIDMSSFIKESNACFLAKASPRVNWLWHKRMSHLNFKNINNLAKQNLVSGLPSLTFSKDKKCSACKKEKHYRASFKTKRSFSINKSLHLLHMDLFGPVKPQTISHNKYTLVIVDEYSRHGKTIYDVFRGRSLDISYFHAFGCLNHIYNHMDHLEKFDKKANDGLFSGYSLVAKAFRVFNIRRQEMEETVHNSITSKEPPEFTIADSPPTIHEPDYAESADILEFAKPQDNVISESISDDQPAPVNSPSTEVILQNPIPQVDGSEIQMLPQYMSVYMSICSLKLNPKSSLKLWMKKDRIKWVFRNKIDEEGVVTKNKARLVAKRVYSVSDGCESAFLNRKISEEVYIEQPPRFESSKFPNHVWKLNKALYGLKQAPRA
nr:retrovirus-related Pol polyprotein from transposon TNT 1-94 [Tanacetum cinerariifolium]